MELSLQVFETAVRKAQTKVANGRVNTVEADLVNDLFINGSPRAQRVFERKVARIYRQKTGKVLTSSITLVVLVGFIATHWAEIVMALKFVLFLFRVRKFRKEMTSDGSTK